MAPVVVTGIVKDETNRRDSREWLVSAPAYREGATGEVVSTKTQPIQVVAGVFTANLEPGPALLVNPEGKKYFITVPDADADLWDLIEQGEGVPPDTSADLLAAAVETFVTSNPGYPWTGLAGRPSALAAGANQPNGFLALGSDGKADAAQLPSYVDDVVEYANQSAFPGTGTTGKIYVALDTGDSFRWSGSAYVRISDRVTASGITDSGAAGRSVVQASTASAVRGVIDAPAAKDAYKALARNPDGLVEGTVTRNSDGAATSAPVVWPDGSPGTYTALTLSTSFPGAVDSYQITYGSPVTATYTQPAVTRDTSGAPTAVPAIVVS